MAPQNMPAAEIEVGPDLVRALLRDQHLDLASLPLVELASGWDNVIYRLGDDFTVRLPRRAAAATLVEHEQRVLPGLAERLPIAIPAPIGVGRPALGYPWSWSVNPWLPGAIAATAPFQNPADEARRLGRFLAALHTEAPLDAPLDAPHNAPPKPPHNPYRGHFVGENTKRVLERIDTLSAAAWFDADGTRDRWMTLVDVEPYGEAPVWLHADLHAANVLVDDGAISAVIDFGDVCAGDPATDLAAAWGLFSDPAHREIVRSHAGDVDDATWQRAEAWALHFALAYLAHSADNPTMGAIGRQLLATLSIPTHH